MSDFNISFSHRGNVKVPCKGCTDRVLGCHSTCEKYNGYLKKSDKLVEIKRKEYMRQADLFND